MSIHDPPIRDEHERIFWELIRDERLSLQRCAECGYWLYPPGPRCPECLSGDLTWRPVEGHGRVWSYTVYEHCFDPDLRDEVPYNVALIELAEGPLVLSNVIDGEPVIGEPVRLAYAQRNGVKRFVFEREERT